MIASRINFAVLVLALAVSSALAQDDNGRATAPPRQLGGSAPAADQPSDLSTGDLSDDTTPQLAKRAQPRRQDDSGARDVSTDDLADDGEPEQKAPPRSGHAVRLATERQDDTLQSDQAEPSNAPLHKSTVETAPLDLPPATGPIVPKPLAIRQVETLRHDSMKARAVRWTRAMAVSTPISGAVRRAAMLTHSWQRRRWHRPTVRCVGLRAA